MTAAPAPADRGAAALEFALVLPVVLAFVGAVITVGVWAASSAMLARGAEATARAVAVPSDFDHLPDPLYHGDAAIVAAADDATPLLDLDAGDVDVAWDAACGTTTCDEGTRFTVTLTHAWTSPAASLLAGLAPGLDTITLRATSTGVRE